MNICPWVSVLMEPCTLSPRCLILFMLVDPFRELSLLGGLRFKAGLLLNGTLALVNGRQLCVARHRRPRLLAAL